MKTLIKIFFLFQILLTIQISFADEVTPDDLTDEQKEAIVLCAHQDQKFNSGLGVLYNFYEKYYERFADYEKKLIEQGKLDQDESFNYARIRLNETVGKRGGYMDAEDGPNNPTTKYDRVANNDTISRKGGYMDAENGPNNPTKKDARVVNNDRLGKRGGYMDAEDGPNNPTTKYDRVANNDRLGKRGGYMDAEDGPNNPTTKYDRVANNDRLGKRGGYMDAEDGPNNPTTKYDRVVNTIDGPVNTIPLIKEISVRRLFVGR